MEYKIFVGHTSGDAAYAADIVSELEKLSRAVPNIGDNSVKIWCMERSTESDWLEEFGKQARLANLIIIVHPRKPQKGCWTLQELNIARKRASREGIPVAVVKLGEFDGFTDADSREDTVALLELFVMSRNGSFQDTVRDIISWCKRRIDDYFKVGALIPESSEIIQPAVFRGRKRLLEKMDKVLETSNYVILTGISGSGKKSLAEQYVCAAFDKAGSDGKKIACKYVEYGDLLRPSPDGVTDDGADLDKLLWLVTTTKEEREKHGSDAHWMNSRKDLVLRVLSENNYVVVTDWNESLDALRRLAIRGIKCKFIITSLIEQSDSYEGLPLINIDLGNEYALADSVEILRAYWPSGAEVSEAEIKEFTTVTGCHPLTLKTIGVGMEKGKLRIGDKTVSSLAEITEKFREIQYIESDKRRGLVRKNIVKAYLKTVLGLGFEGLEDEAFKREAKEVLWALSLFSSNGIPASIAHALMANSSVMPNWDDVVVWLNDMNYIVRVRGRLCLHPLISEIAYTYSSPEDNSVRNEFRKKAEEMFSAYVRNYLWKAGQGDGRQAYLYTSFAAEIAKENSSAIEAVGHMLHVLKARNDVFDRNKIADMYFTVARFYDDDGTYYSKSRQNYEEQLQEIAPDDYETIFDCVSGVFATYWNSVGESKRSEFMPAIIEEYRGRYREYRVLAKCAEHYLMLGDLRKAFECYKESLAVFCAQVGQCDETLVKLCDEMLRHCKSVAPLLLYNRCKEVCDELHKKGGMNEACTVAVGKMESVMDEVVKSARVYADQYGNAANILSDKARAEFDSDERNNLLKQEYVCLVQALSLSDLADDGIGADYYGKLIENLRAEVAVDLDDYTDEYVEKLTELYD